MNLVAIAAALTFVEPRVERTTEPTYAEHLRQGLRIVRRREGVALLIGLEVVLGLVTFLPCAYNLARWRTTVAPWPCVTPVPSGLVAGGRISRFHRLFERMSRLRP